MGEPDTGYLGFGMGQIPVTVKNKLNINLPHFLMFVDFTFKFKKVYLGYKFKTEFKEAAHIFRLFKIRFNQGLLKGTVWKDSNLWCDNQNVLQPYPVQPHPVFHSPPLHENNCYFNFYSDRPYKKALMVGLSLLCAGFYVGFGWSWGHKTGESYYELFNYMVGRLLKKK